MIRFVRHSLLSIVSAVPVWQASPVPSSLTHPSEPANRAIASHDAGRLPSWQTKPSPLDHVIAVDLRAVTLHQALDTIQTCGAVELNFVPAQVDRVAAPITLRDRHITVRKAIVAVLNGTALRATETSTGQIVIAGADEAAGATRHAGGGIHGRAFEALNNRPLRYATVTLDGTRTTTTTDTGTYRFENVTPAVHTVSTRALGYSPIMHSVTVREGEDVVADFALTKSASQLDQVVVTGTIVPTEVKALPTPITVITDSEIAQQRPHTIEELFRQNVPGAVSWDMSAFPFQTSFSVRGASSLTGGGQMKVFVDGIEVANPGYAGTDPQSIARIEVIRGPQAAAIYGSDAIGGVIQIFTKRGDANRRPQIVAEGTLGMVQTPYAGFRGVAQQTGALSVRGGGSDFGYSVGGSYSHTADWIPYGEQSGQSSPSVYGGVHVTQGIVSLDLSGRDLHQNDPSIDNPLLHESGYYYFSKPEHQPYQTQNQTIGARLNLTPVAWWQSTATVGLDRWVLDLAQTQPRLTTPGDTLLTIYNQTQTKTSLGFVTSAQGRLAPNITGSLTAGVEHYDFPATSSYAAVPPSLVGTGSYAGAVANRTNTSNTGYFGQGQIGLGDALFVTGGLRAERNSNFGDSLGTPVSPQVGVAYVRAIGAVTLKLRASYGKAILAPSPAQKIGSDENGFVTLANYRLGPQRQSGTDVGMDMTLGSHLTLGITYYNQTADNLIQSVQLHSDTLPTFQYENVGRVKNTGVETEGAIRFGRASLNANFAYTPSRIVQLPPSYGGDLRVGDEPFDTPWYTAGASLMVNVLKSTTVAAGLTYVGVWKNYDDLAYFRCLGGTAPCRNSTGAEDRSYLKTFPSFVKVNLTVTQSLTHYLTGFVSIDNLTNNYAYEANNSTPVMGRRTSLGFRAHN